MDREYPPQCRATMLPGDPPDDPSRCSLPEGHAGSHAPLPVVWQMAGFIQGPWTPPGSAVRILPTEERLPRWAVARRWAREFFEALAKVMGARR
jgi:hypothetical protein